MRLSVLPLLACPSCLDRSGGDLVLDVAEMAADGHVMSGTLTCPACRHAYPIDGGVPRLIPGTVATAATQTAGRFGEQWKTFTHMSDYQEDWLKRWLDPVGPHDVRGKVILEGGCGKGRHTVVVAGWGAKAIVSVDLGEAVDVAFEHSRALESAHVVQGDLLHPPVRRAFDLAFSVGVLHHLPQPRAGFDALRGRVRPGGRIAIWVYGYENNEWIVKLVNPVRERVTARMPSRLLYWMSLPPSAALTAYTRLYRSESVASRLPYAAYMKRLAELPLREVHNIVYDQLVTPIAFYLPEGEVRAWFESTGLSDVQMAWHNENSWRGTAVVTGT